MQNDGPWREEEKEIRENEGSGKTTRVI